MVDALLVDPQKPLGRHWPFGRPLLDALPFAWLENRDREVARLLRLGVRRRCNAFE